MAFYEMLPGAGMPSGLQAGMDSVLNKKFGTSTTYAPEGWPDNVNLMGPLPEKTVSGAIVTFADGADEVPLKKCEITLPASLDGYNQVNVKHAGKNLAVFDDGTYTAGGVTFTCNNQVVTASNTSTTTYPQAIIAQNLFFKKGTYTASITVENEPSGGNFYIILQKGGSNYVSTKNGSSTFTLTEDSQLNFLAVAEGNGITWNDATLKFQIEAGSTATTYEPYTSPTTHTADLGRTINGGSVDVENGSGESKCGKIVFDGSSDENWTAYAGGNGYLIAVADMERGTWYTSEFAESSPLPKVPDNNSLGVRIGVNNNGIYVVQANTIAGVTDLATFKAYLAENPLTVIYPLDDSEPFTFDPVPIDSKLGNNTLWSEQGSSAEVTYRADIALALGE